MSNGIDYEAILIELEDAYRETESKVGSWQKKVLLLILKTLITIISDIKQCFMYTAFGERHVVVVHTSTARMLKHIVGCRPPEVVCV